jgi:ABC-type transporter Mla maintaining outer membrane lipid asymmetry ATPase subunit MlaF
LMSAGTTRLLVTHQRQFLPGCDAVVVLRGGEVAAAGSYAELAAAGVPEVKAVEGGRAAVCLCVGVLRTCVCVCVWYVECWVEPWQGC